MGWIESLPYFLMGPETGRDVAAQYIEAPVGSLPDHMFQHLTEVNGDFRDVETD